MAAQSVKTRASSVEPPRVSVPPVVAAAAGLAAALYLPPGSGSRALASVIAACAASIALSMRFAPSPRSTISLVTKRRLRAVAEPAIGGLRRAASALAAALAAGLCCGAWCHARVEAGSARFSPGLGGPYAPGAAAYEARVASDPTHTAGGLLACELELEAALGRDGERVTASGRVVVYVRGSSNGGAPRDGRPGEAPVRGQRLRVALRRGLLPPRTGGGSWRDALASPYAFVDAAGVEAIGPPPAAEAARAALRAGALESLRAAGGEAGPLLEALVVGVRDELDPELSAGFRAAGCAHILALSGQHVGILASFVAVLLGFALGPRRARAVACLLAAAYLYLVGASPSVARAVAMFWATSALLAADRPQPAVVTLSAVFIVAVVVDPAAAHELSFGLSYLAVAGIGVLGGAYEFGLRRWLPPPAAGAVAVGFAALAATAPLSLLAFGTLNLFSPVASALAGLLVAALIWAGLVGSFVVALVPWAAPAARLACLLPYRALVAVIGTAARLPSIALSEDWTGWRAAMAGVVACAAAFVYAWPHVAYRIESRRRAASSQLRRPLGAVSHARRPRPRHAQEVRTEFPGLGSRQEPHSLAVRDRAGRARLGDRPGRRRHDPGGAAARPEPERVRDR